MKKQYARIFLYFFGLIAFLPLFQQLFHPFKLAGLQGAFDAGAFPELNYHSWFDGTFQQKSDFYLKNNTAFNGDLVRLRNQIDYSFFGNINTILTLGKEDYLFDPNYSTAMSGADLLSDSILNYKSLMLHRAKSVLDSFNIPILFCIAPNKANYYSEYLPEEVDIKSKTNQAYFKNVLHGENINVLDFDSLFKMLKRKTAFPLIPKYGAHWSTYGASIAGNEFLNSISSITGRNIISFKTLSTETSNVARFTDDDYLASLNLMIKWKSPLMAYPQLSFRNSGYKPNVLIISDSFIWNFYTLKIVPECFSVKSEIRYYNKTSFDIFKNKTGTLPDKISAETIKGRDIIIVLATGPSLKDFGFSFFDQLSELKK